MGKKLSQKPRKQRQPGSSRPLTVTEQTFIDAYAGSIIEASKLANLDYENCRQMAIKPHIKDRLRAKIAKRNSKIIASRDDRQAFWTSIVNDRDQEMRDRLKASELLGRSFADFTEKVEHTGDLDVSVNIDI